MAPVLVGAPPAVGASPRKARPRRRDPASSARGGGDEAEEPTGLARLDVREARAGEGRDAVPDELRAQYLTQSFKQATCAAYVPVFSWYALHPTPWDPQEYTLVDRQLRPTQTYDALVAWSRQVAEVTGG